MLQEHTPSTDSLDVINDAIIRNTFLGYTEKEPETNAATVEEKEKDSYCCSDNCFKWWFFHSSFQASKKSIILTWPVCVSENVSCKFVFYFL